MTGGGSGGHIYPLVSVISELQILATQEEVNLEIRYLGVVGSYEGLLRENGVRVEKILSSKLRRYFSLANVIDGPKFVISFFQALWKMLWFMPDVLFTKGGPGALAVVFVARLYRVPIIVHESDTIPGITNMITSKYARAIVVSFPSTPEYFEGKDVIVTGNPIRRYLFSDPLTQSKAKLFLGFDQNVPLVLILGGSQGAVRLNDFILDNLVGLLQFTQIFHQTGKANYESVIGEGAVVGRDLSEETKRRYKAIDYLEKQSGKRHSKSGTLLPDRLMKLHPALQREMIFQALLATKGDLKGIRHAHILSILSMARSAAGHPLKLPGVTVKKTGNILRFHL